MCKDTEVSACYRLVRAPSAEVLNAGLRCAKNTRIGRNKVSVTYKCIVVYSPPAKIILVTVIVIVGVVIVHIGHIGHIIDVIGMVHVRCGPGTRLAVVASRGIVDGGSSN